MNLSTVRRAAVCAVAATAALTATALPARADVAGTTTWAVTHAWSSNDESWHWNITHNQDYFREVNRTIYVSSCRGGYRVRLTLFVVAANALDNPVPGSYTSSTEVGTEANAEVTGCDGRYLYHPLYVHEHVAMWDAYGGGRRKTWDYYCSAAYCPYTHTTDGNHTELPWNDSWVGANPHHLSPLETGSVEAWITTPDGTRTHFLERAPRERARQ